jgi:hypothetical protein
MATYRIERRTKSKQGERPLKTFALDLTIYFGEDGAAFLQDHNGKDYPAPYTNVEDFLEQLALEIRRNYDEYFGSASTDDKD